MISIALCDNEVEFLDFYEEKIKKISKKLNILCEIIRFTSGESLLFYLEDNPNKFQIIYLDIIIGGINGIETALEIRKFNKFAKIIFLTSSDSFVYNAFEANATNYLLKSTHDNKFEDIFISTIDQLNLSLSNEVIKFKNQKEEIILSLKDITYIESYKRLAIVNLFDKTKYEFYYKLSDLTKELSNKSFILIHRSFLVNQQYIQKISKTELTLKNNITLPISRALYQKVKEQYVNYLNGLSKKQ